MASVLMIVLLMILMSMTSNLFWYVVKAKEDVECGEIPDQAALCTFPVEYDHPNVDNKQIFNDKDFCTSLVENDHTNVDNQDNENYTTKGRKLHMQNYIILDTPVNSRNLYKNINTSIHRIDVRSFFVQRSRRQQFYKCALASSMSEGDIF